MAFVVVYDACVLYPAPLRDLLIRLANTGVVRARWPAPILDECFRNILENRPDLKPESLERTRELMTQAVPDCMVTNFEGLIDALVLPNVVRHRPQSLVASEASRRTGEDSSSACPLLDTRQVAGSGDTVNRVSASAASRRRRTSVD
jgi:hypothetical protein